MNLSKKIDALDKIKQFQKKVLAQKPNISEMMHEVRMMNFKVRPVSGNIADLDYQNDQFIDALWSLGKLDEFFKREFATVGDEEREAFFRMVDELRINFQNQLRLADIAAIEFDDRPFGHFFEMEIIKDNKLKVN